MRRNALDPFPLLELLDQFPGVFTGQLLPALEPRHQAALALSCTRLRAAVQGAATTLTLRAGQCCLSRDHDLATHLPHIKQLVLKPGNLHEAMFVLPLLFMQVDVGVMVVVQKDEQARTRPALVAVHQIHAQLQLTLPCACFCCLPYYITTCSAFSTPQAALHMRGLTSLHLHDLLPDRCVCWLVGALVSGLLRMRLCEAC